MPHDDCGSTRKRPAVFIVLAVLLFFARLATGIVTGLRTPAPAEPLVWKTPAEAEIESHRASKPVLFIFLEDRNLRCRRFEREMILEPKTRVWLTGFFVPVQVVNRRGEGIRNSAQVEFFVTKYHVDDFPTFVILYPDGRDPEILAAYPGKQRTIHFLSNALRHDKDLGK